MNHYIRVWVRTERWERDSGQQEADGQGQVSSGGAVGDVLLTGPGQFIPQYLNEIVTAEQVR